jgi:serine protease AprX
MIARPPKMVSVDPSSLQPTGGLTGRQSFVIRRNAMNTQNTVLRKAIGWLATLMLIMTLIAMPAGGVSGKGKPGPKTDTNASYLVQGTTAKVAGTAVTRCGGKVTSSLEIIDSVGATLTTDQVTCVKGQKGVIAVTPNSKVGTSGTFVKDNKTGTAPATDYPDVTGADAVQIAKGITGKRVTVAVVDTGVAPQDGIKASRIVGWADFIDGSKKPIDPNGHGTHVAGVIANSQLGADGEPNGMAPEVNLAVARVLDENGTSTYEKVIQGIQWVVQNKTKYNIKVLNLSLVSTVKSPYWADPLNRAVMKAWSLGITVVVAAGNSGPNPMTISVPGNVPYVITVGAFTDHFTPMKFQDDYLTPFSAAGPTQDGFVKPDVIAPGAHMVSTMPNGSVVALDNQGNKVAENYYWLAGTSQASAVVSGIAALTIAKNPRLTPNEVKYRIVSTAMLRVDPVTHNASYSIWQQGAGRVDAPDAVLAKISGRANKGMNIYADLMGFIHYSGTTYYDNATGTFRLDSPYANMAGGYGVWNGQYTAATCATPTGIPCNDINDGTWTPAGDGAWSGLYSKIWKGLNDGAWSGGDGAWSGGDGAWSGGDGAWSGGDGAWSGLNDGAWSNGDGAWSGTDGAWSGGDGAWSGDDGAWSGNDGSWIGGDGSWSGGDGSWSGGDGSWIGGDGSWIGGKGHWPGGDGSWAGGDGSWAGGDGSWAGGDGSWAGGDGSWAGGDGSWAGGDGSGAGGDGSWTGGDGVWSGATASTASFSWLEIKAVP